MYVCAIFIEKCIRFFVYSVNIPKYNKFSHKLEIVILGRQFL